MHFERPAILMRETTPAPQLVLSQNDLEVAEMAANVNLIKTQHEFGDDSVSRPGRVLVDAASDTRSHMGVLPESEFLSVSQDFTRHNRTTEVRVNPEGNLHKLDPLTTNHVLGGLATMARLARPYNVLGRMKFNITRAHAVAAKLAVEQLAGTRPRSVGRTPRR